MVAIRIGVGQYQDPKTKRRINAASEDAADRALKIGKYSKNATAKPGAKTPAEKPTDSQKSAVFPGAESTTQAGQPVNLNTGAGVVDAQTNTSSNFVKDINPIVNPALQSNPGGTRSITYNESGQPIIEDQLSTANQKVLGGLQDAGVNAGSNINSLLTGGIYNSLNNPAGAGQPGAANPNAQAGLQSNYEKAIFDRLTYGLDRQRKQEQEQLEQTLANRGIPVGSTAYSNQVRDFNDRYDTQMQNARNNAVIGGQQLAQGALGSLSGVQQSGFYKPEFQGFNSVNPGQPVDMSQLAQIFGQFSLGQQAQNTNAKNAATNAQQAKTAAELAARRGTGARPQGTPQSTAFSTSPLPGTGAP